MAEDGALRRAAAKEKVDVFRHTWHKPRWPFVQPVHDATADTTRIDNYLADHYAVLAEQGYNADDVRDRTLKFNKSCIVKAIELAKEINKEMGVEVHWRRVQPRAAAVRAGDRSRRRTRSGAEEKRRIAVKVDFNRPPFQREK
jgi:hypothetical protein